MDIDRHWRKIRNSGGREGPGYMMNEIIRELS